MLCKDGHDAPSMSHPQPKLSEYTEFLPTPEPRTPLPITSLPSNAITEEVDPTLEIRTLIGQLQQTSRDARTQNRATEQEKDRLAHQLSRAEQEIELLRENERDLRSHFVEVTALIQQRDAAVEEGERRGRALADATQKVESTARERSEAQRQRDEAARQRDETVRKFEAYSRATDEQSRLIGESQKQLLNIRQARDGAHAQVIELTNKITQAEDEAADREYQRELAEKALKQAAAEAAEFRRQLEATTLDSDVTAQQVEELTRELDGQRRKLLDFAEQKSAVLQAGSEQLAALAEARAQVLSSTQERDAARNRAQEQARDLDELRVQFQKFRDEEAQSTAQALAEAHDKLAGAETQARESRHGAKNALQKVEAASQQLATLQTLGDTAAMKQAESERQIESLSTGHAAALASLDAAQKEMEAIIGERDQACAQVTENALIFEAQLSALRSQMAGIEGAATDAKARQDDLSVLQKRFERQRVETIDIVARLQTAQLEIRELSASLAEARLHLKFATDAARAEKNGATRSDFAGLVTESASAIAPESAAPIEPPAVSIEESLTEKEARSALGAMRQCFQSFTKTPADLSLLNELHCHAHSFSERARITGHLAIHRLCGAFSELTSGLYAIPEQVNPSTLRTVQQTIEFLGTLIKDRTFALAQDLAKAQIYAVDDDPDNCDAIRMTMETAAMRTICAQDPLDALADLAGRHCDLIFLDVGMPGMDGFELCKQIRALPFHASTPVVFLTGLATLENRVQSTLCGGNDFIAKPFNLHELSVKAMTLILKNQLKLT